MRLRAQKGESLVTVMVSVALLGITAMLAVDVVKLSVQTSGAASQNFTWNSMLTNLNFALTSSSECKDLFRSSTGPLVINSGYLQETNVYSLKWHGNEFIRSGRDVERMTITNFSTTPEIRPIYDNSVPPVLIENHNRYSTRFDVFDKTENSGIIKKPQSYLLYIETDSSDVVQTCYMKLCGQENPPQANTDNQAVAQSKTTLIDVLANDKNMNLDEHPLQIISVGAATNGVTSIQGGKIAYEAGSGLVSDSFEYTISDGCMETVGQVNVLVVAKLQVELVGDVAKASSRFVNVKIGLPGATDNKHILRYTANSTIEPDCTTGTLISNFGPSTTLSMLDNYSNNPFLLKMVVCNLSGIVEGKNTIQIFNKGYVTWSAPTKIFVVPVGVNKIWISLWGGGGGGGGGDNVASEGGGGGGGAESFFLCPFDVSPGQVLTFIPGSGGVGGAANTNGGDGGDSTIHTMTAKGGKGGKGGSLTSPGAGGDGGGTGVSGGAPGMKGSNATIGVCYSTGSGGGGGGYSAGWSGAGGTTVTTAGGAGGLAAGTDGAGGGGGSTLFGVGGCGLSATCTYGTGSGASYGAGGRGNIGGPVSGAYNPKGSDGAGGGYFVNWIVE